MKWRTSKCYQLIATQVPYSNSPQTNTIIARCWQGLSGQLSDYLRDENEGGAGKRGSCLSNTANYLCDKGVFYRQCLVY